MISNMTNGDSASFGALHKALGRRTWGSLPSELPPEEPAPEEEPYEPEPVIAMWTYPPARSKLPPERKSPFKHLAPSVSQAYLVRYQELKERSREYQAFRREILSRLDDGAWVEPGELSVTVREYRQQRLTQAFLTEALGLDRVRELKEQAAPTVYRHLIVREEGAGGGRGVGADTL
jgi:hypothetical protein